jgi:hypothetical protein
MGPYDVAVPESPKPKAPQTSTTTVTRVEVRDNVTTTTATTTTSEAPTPVPAPTPAPPPDNVELTIPDDGVPVKIMLDDDIDSGYLRNRDTVAFTVIDDVVMFDGTDGTQTMRCVVIPKATKVYGVVDKSRGRQLFNWKGGGQLFIFLEKVTLDNGLTYALHFSYPDDGVTRAYKKKDWVLRDCENTKNVTNACIIGRRTRTTVDPAILGSGAEGAVLFSNNTDKQVARISLFAILLKAAGLTALVNQPNAGFKAKSVFQARLEWGKDSKGNDVKTIWRARPKKQAEEPAEKPK